MTKRTAKDWIDHLELQPHPEGGFYRETFRAPELLAARTLARYDSSRNISTSIYYLLQSGDVSHFHRLKSDEIWHFYDGSFGLVHFIDDEGKYWTKRCGLNIDEKAHPQLFIPKNTWFGAEVGESDSYILIGCTVAPGFEFEDFQLASRHHLLDLFPQHESIVNKLTFKTA